MRRIQFWILMAGSVFVCVLYLEQIYLSRAIYQQQRILIASQQFVSYAPTYENSWKQLATRIYELSRQDDALADVLKRNQIAIQANKPASTSASPSQSLPASPSKAPTTQSKTSSAP